LEEDYLQYVSVLDNDGLQRLMEAYGEDVWCYAYFICKQRDLADDVAQEVFIKAFRHIGAFRGQCTVKTWLLKITRNTAYSYRRKSFFRKAVLMEFISGVRPSAEKEFLDQHLTDEIWGIVLQLPVPYREVLLLHAMHGLSMEEIANALGIPEGTVKSRISRGRRKAVQLAKGRVIHEEL
jgi:RNA polymerase sigma-70 factor (ECF subfamily)